MRGSRSGALIDLVVQLHRNGGNFDCVDWGEVAIAGGAGAVAAVVGIVAWGAIVPYTGSTLIGYMGAGGLSGIVAGQAARTTTLALSGRSNQIISSFARPEDVLSDFGLGAVFGGIGYGIQSAINYVRYGLRISVGVPDEFLPPSARGDILYADQMIAYIRGRLPVGKSFANLTPSEWQAIIPSGWQSEFGYYPPQVIARQNGILYNFTGKVYDPVTQTLTEIPDSFGPLPVAQWKFTSPDEFMEIRLHAAQPPYDTSWVARIGIQSGVPGTKGLTSFGNPQNALEPRWVYFDQFGNPTGSSTAMHIPINGWLRDFINIFPGFYP